VAVAEGGGREGEGRSDCYSRTASGGTCGCRVCTTQG